ncbi:4768_t:CDS:2, partial [Ambispora leptoticha]
KWRITNRSIDYTTGLCGTEENTLDVRKITDLKYRRSCFQLLTGRGTLVIYSNDNTDPELRISSRGMRETYRKLKEVWTSGGVAPSVQIFEHHH